MALLAERLTCKEPPALAAHGPAAAAFSVNSGLRPTLERNLACRVELTRDEAALLRELLTVYLADYHRDVAGTETRSSATPFNADATSSRSSSGAWSAPPPSRRRRQAKGGGHGGLRHRGACGAGGG